MAPRKKTKASFGSVRKLKSGRWQARYTEPDGIRRAAPDIFETKTAARDWLTQQNAEILHDAWTDPDAGKIYLTDYADRWITEREVKTRTR